MLIPEDAGSPQVFAAGVVALRGSGKRTEALVVHRGDRADWSLPKGKTEPGERLAATAVREALEETGIDVVLGVPLQTARYSVVNPAQPLVTAKKSVNYWLASPRDPAIAAGDVDVPEHWQPNHEIAEVRWVRVSKLPGLLTYPHDLEIVREAVDAPFHTSAFIVLRHAQAEKRSLFRARMGEEIGDVERPLTEGGQVQAQALAQVLAAYGIHGVHSSSAVRCMQTVQPFAKAIGAEVDAIDAITEEAFAEHPKRGVEEVLGLLRNAPSAVVCIHRPTKKRLVREIGWEVDQQVSMTLAPAEYLVFHRNAKIRKDGTSGKLQLGHGTVIEYGLHH